MFVFMNFTLKVDIGYDAGDPSVGIRGGWGREDDGCFLEFKELGYRIGWFFDIDEKKPVDEWIVRDVQLSCYGDSGRTGVIHLASTNEGWGEGPKVWRKPDETSLHQPQQMKLADAPVHVLTAVRLEWQRVQQIVNEETARENAMLEEMHRDDVLNGSYPACDTRNEDGTRKCDVCNDLEQSGQITSNGVLAQPPARSNRS